MSISWCVRRPAKPECRAPDSSVLVAAARHGKDFTQAHASCAISYTFRVRRDACAHTKCARQSN